jgi:hypothetical protein
MATDNAKVFQYLNTVLLTIICGFSMIIFLTVNNVKKEQQIQATELVRLKTIQDLNVSNVAALNLRVTTLETNSFDVIKTWVDANYVRKPQK